MLPGIASAQNGPSSGTATSSAEEANRLGREALARNDYATALVWLRKAADQGNGAASGSIGLMYLYGRGVPKDGGQALTWLRKSADLGEITANTAIGLMYVNGDGVAKDYAQGIFWLRKGDATGQYTVGIMYRDGMGVAKDYAQAMNWFRKAADQGSPDAENSIGAMYNDGNGVPRDYALAMTWLRKAADQGHAEAQYNVGWMYEHGRGVALDYSQAALWYGKSADQGDADAQISLAGLYLRGRGVRQDTETGLMWAKKAATQGHARAQAALGAMYGNGELGVTQNTAAAIKWFSMAAAQGYPEAQENLRRLQSSSDAPPENRSVADTTETQNTPAIITAAGVPSDNDIIKALKERLRREQLQSIANEYGDIDKLNPNPTTFLNGMTSASAAPMLACTLNAPNAREACINRAKAALRAERDARIKAAKSEDFGANFIYGVQEKINYEGTYVALVNVRVREADKTWQQKVSLKFQDGAWVVTDREEKRIR